MQTLKTFDPNERVPFSLPAGLLNLLAETLQNMVPLAPYRLHHALVTDLATQIESVRQESGPAETPMPVEQAVEVIERARVGRRANSNGGP